MECETLTEINKSGAVKKCPLLDIQNKKCTETELQDFLLRLASFYFGRPLNEITLEMNLYEDLENYLYTDGFTKPLSYGKLFVDFENPNTTGLSDQGLTVWLFLGDMFNALGLEDTTAISDKDANNITLKQVLDKIVVFLTETEKILQ